MLLVCGVVIVMRVSGVISLFLIMYLFTILARNKPITKMIDAIKSAGSHKPTAFMLKDLINVDKIRQGNIKYSTSFDITLRSLVVKILNLVNAAPNKATNKIRADDTNTILNGEIYTDSDIIRYFMTLTNIYKFQNSKSLNCFLCLFKKTFSKVMIKMDDLKFIHNF